VLWSAIEDPSPLKQLARTLPSSLVLLLLRAPKKSRCSDIFSHHVLCYVISGSLHEWIALHEPSLLQSVYWGPFTPHVTLLKVRAGHNKVSHRIPSDSKTPPSIRVLNILRSAISSADASLHHHSSGPHAPQEREGSVGQCNQVYKISNQYKSNNKKNERDDDDAIEGEIILYKGLLYEEKRREDERRRKQERQERGRPRPASLGRESYNQPVDMGRYLGRQVVESFELLAMQGSEELDALGRGGYPVYGRIFLNRR